MCGTPQVLPSTKKSPKILIPTKRLWQNHWKNIQISEKKTLTTWGLPRRSLPVGWTHLCTPGRWLLCCRTWQLQQSELDTEQADGAASADDGGDRCWSRCWTKTLNSLLGGGFKYFFIFIPTWGDDPIWRAYFSDGVVQPPTRLDFCIFFKNPQDFVDPSWSSCPKCRLMEGEGHPGSFCRSVLGGFHRSLCPTKLQLGMKLLRDMVS